MVSNPNARLFLYLLVGLLILASESWPIGAFGPGLSGPASKGLASSYQRNPKITSPSLLKLLSGDISFHPKTFDDVHALIKDDNKAKAKSIEIEIEAQQADGRRINLSVPWYFHSNRFHKHFPFENITLHSEVFLGHSQWLVHIKSNLNIDETIKHFNQKMFPYKFHPVDFYLPHNTLHLVAPEEIAHKLFSKLQLNPNEHNHKNENDLNSSSPLVIVHMEPHFKYSPSLINQLHDRLNKLIYPRYYHKAYDHLQNNHFHINYKNNRRKDDNDNVNNDNCLASVYVSLSFPVVDTSNDNDKHENKVNSIFESLKVEGSFLWTKNFVERHRETKILSNEIFFLEFFPLDHLDPWRHKIKINFFNHKNFTFHTSQHQHLNGAASVDINSFGSEIIKLISLDSLVESIELAPSFSLSNKYAKYVVQNAPDPLAGNSYNVNTPPYLHRHNIQGQNQIIAHGDTGIDFDSCFFYDEFTELPLNRITGNHRKFVTYQMMTPNPSSDLPGDYQGHGTHTGGSLGANVLRNSHVTINDAVLQGVSYYDGMAPKAKLAVFDFERQNDNTLYIPDNIYADYLRLHLPTGAMISSNSWGDDTGTYDSFSRDVDRFVIDNPEFIMVVAAGNSGENGLLSIGTPAVAKNLITVGASENAAASWMELGHGSGIKIFQPQLPPLTISAYPASFGPRFTSHPLVESAQLVFAIPSDGCNSLTNSANVQNKIVFIDRGNCAFTTKISHAEAAGALFMIVINNDPNESNFAMDGQIASNIPSVLISAQDGAIFHKSAPELAAMRISLPVPVAGSFDDSILADFSSRGPAQDGRIKPDILAPGQYIQSSHSTSNTHDFQCSSDSSGIVQMEGTSMATPIIAGHAALIRQYFMEGHYTPPFGNSPPSPFTPTSALVKAILIQSGVSVSGSVVDHQHGGRSTVQAPPSPYQGFGRAQLDRTLTFPDVPLNNYTLYVLDDRTRPLTSNSEISHCFNVDPSLVDAYSSFRATLVWIDPLPLSSSSQQLVNDLDLIIMYYPNNNDIPHSTWIGNQNNYLNKPGPQWDSINNVEKIEIVNPKPGIYRVIVRAGNLVNNAQNFALVVNGPYLPSSNEASCPHSIICVNDCSGHGLCIQPVGAHFSIPAPSIAVCECEPYYAGADCSILATKLSVGTVAVIAQASTFSYFYYEALDSDITQSLSFSFQKLADGGDPDYYISLPNTHAPTLTHYSFANTDNDANSRNIHTISIPAGAITAGRYMIGVWGYCCVDSIPLQITVNAQIFHRPTTPSATPTTSIPTTTLLPTTPLTTTPSPTTPSPTTVLPTTSDPLTTSAPTTVLPTTPLPSTTVLSTTFLPSPVVTASPSTSIPSTIVLSTSPLSPTTIPSSISMSPSSYPPSPSFPSDSPTSGLPSSSLFPSTPTLAPILYLAKLDTSYGVFNPPPSPAHIFTYIIQLNNLDATHLEINLGTSNNRHPVSISRAVCSDLTCGQITDIASLCSGTGETCTTLQATFDLVGTQEHYIAIILNYGTSAAVIYKMGVVFPPATTVMPSTPSFDGPTTPKFKIPTTKPPKHDIPTPSNGPEVATSFMPNPTTLITNPPTLFTSLPTTLDPATLTPTPTSTSTLTPITTTSATPTPPSITDVPTFHPSTLTPTSGLPTSISSIPSSPLITSAPPPTTTLLPSTPSSISPSSSVILSGLRTQLKLLLSFDTLPSRAEFDVLFSNEFTKLFRDLTTKTSSSVECSRCTLKITVESVIDTLNGNGLRDLNPHLAGMIPSVIVDFYLVIIPLDNVSGNPPTSQKFWEIMKSHYFNQATSPTPSFGNSTTIVNPNFPLNTTFILLNYVDSNFLSSITSVDYLFCGNDDPSSGFNPGSTSMCNPLVSPTDQNDYTRIGILNPLQFGLIMAGIALAVVLVIALVCVLVRRLKTFRFAKLTTEEEEEEEEEDTMHPKDPHGHPHRHPKHLNNESARESYDLKTNPRLEPAVSTQKQTLNHSESISMTVYPYTNSNSKYTVDDYDDEREEFVNSMPSS